MTSANSNKFDANNSHFSASLLLLRGRTRKVPELVNYKDLFHRLDEDKPIRDTKTKYEFDGSTCDLLNGLAPPHKFTNPFFDDEYNLL